MDKKYKVTVIGAGARGNIYLAMLKKYHADDIIFAGICDILEDRLNKTYAEYGFAAKFTDYKQAIAESKPDIVIVAVPAFYHCDVASFAMDNGCHVLTEKPFDLSLKKCLNLKEKSKQTDRLLAIGLQYRNNMGNRSLKHMMDKRLIGKNVVMSFADIRQNRPKLAMHDACFGNGGPMTDMACHYFDLMRWYYGSDPKSVSAVWRISSEDRPYLASIKNKAPDSAVITVEYESGDMGTMILNWSLPVTNERSFHASSVTGSEGFVLPAELQNPPELKVFSSGAEITIKPEPEDELDCVKAEKGVFDHLVAEIEGRGKVQASFNEGILSLAASMAAIKSGSLGRAVTIKEILEGKPTVFECMNAKKLGEN
ncbi:MAG: Gfo/Idh/MocA family oxidoreductase [Treponema sp.]|nr:Gfo/Idh/MocA family oxidoreductase [Treponema sp.]